MAESILVFVLEQLTKFLHSMQKWRKSVEELREGLVLIRPLLQDAEERQLRDDRVKNWLDALKDALFDGDDLIDEWNFRLLTATKVRVFGRTCFSSFRKSEFVDEIGQSLQIIIRMKKEGTDSLGLGHRSIEAGFFPLEEPHKKIKVEPIEPDIYGRDYEKETILSKLLAKDSDEHNFSVIGIYGMGGIGKTTLARVINKKLNDTFDVNLWVSVPDLKDSLSIAKKIISDATRKFTYESRSEDVFALFRQLLEGKKYLLVLDDVWNEDWAPLKKVFNCGAPGSKILLTTRMVTVAQKAGSGHIIHLGGLSDVDCWALIMKHTFVTQEQKTCLAELGMEIAKKCRGLPVMAKFVGAILGSKTSVKEWEEVLDDSIWEFSQQNLDLEDSLMWFYSRLPFQLKQCLLYCSIFPRGYSIDGNNLIKHWMAQGYLGLNEIEMERKGLLYIEELWERSFFCEYTMDVFGNPKCKLEGIVSDLIRFLAQNECHSLRIDNKTEVDHFFTKARHWTINVASHTPLPVSVGHSEKLRVLMFLSDFTSADSKTVGNLLSQTKRLRALDLSHCSLEELPLKVGKLLHLRYLNLSFNLDIKELSESVCDLANLQTLILNGCENLRKLPKGIGRLKLLRHLEILWTMRLDFLPKGVATLPLLRTLNRFICGVGSEACNLSDLKPLNRLQQYMSIDALGGVTDVFLAKEANLKNKKDLLSLDLSFTRVEPERPKDDCVLEALEAPPNLEKLQISYYEGSSFPCWMMALVKLKHLILFYCTKCEKLPALGKLPLLESLEIKNMTQVKKVGPELLGLESNGGEADRETLETHVDIEAGADNKNVMLAVRLNIGDGVTPDSGVNSKDSTVVFPKLKKLGFQNLCSWEEWEDITEKGANVTIMPLLSSLSIVNCWKITALPNYVERKENLSFLIEKCPRLKL